MIPRVALPALIPVVLLGYLALHPKPATQAAHPAPEQAARAAKPASGVLDFRRADYMEDEGTGRALAQIEATLLRSGHGAHGARLRLRISAEGAFVDPVPGFEGIRGANRNTAREMENIVRDARAVVLTSRLLNDAGNRTAGVSPVLGAHNRRDAGTVFQHPASGADSQAQQIGTIGEGRRATIPERRVLGDGRIDWQARTDGEYLVELLVDSGEVGMGAHATEVLVDGTPRLRVRFGIEGGGGKIIGVESLGLARRQHKATAAAPPSRQDAGATEGGGQ